MNDTIIVELASTSKVVLTIRDRADIEVLKEYNFQKLFSDILVKLENNDTSALAPVDTINSVEAPVAKQEGEDVEEDWRWQGGSDDDDDDDWESYDYHNNRWGRTRQSFNFEFGTNNYLTDGRFPNSDNELYAVRPWGSWYVGLSSVQRTRLGKKFFLEWGAGINWYNFKFEDDNVLMQKDDNMVQFVPDDRPVNFVKSKLTASYLMATLVPVLDFGGHGRKPRIWEGSNAFRIGLGPYIGYRIGSHSKLVYKDDGKEQDKNYDSFYLNNIRYGARLQLGYRSADFFFNYDINELFTEGRGPDLNAFSFGVIF
jgi:hypothetical protein